MIPAVTPQLSADWSRIQAELRAAVGDATYELWLGALVPRSYADDRLVVGAPAQVLAWVADRFDGVLTAATRAVLGPATVVEVVDRRAALPEPTPESAAPTHRRTAARPGETGTPLHPKLTFQQFVIGDGNRFAHAAALAVAEAPGAAYNPLFLYGPPGTGKTHLLQSIGHYIHAFGGGLVVQHVTAERFTNEFVSAIQTGGIEAFKARFRHIDVLLVDDVQFLQSKVKTEEEFFHTFNALHEAGAQLVLTCDRLPTDLKALEDRLLERFRAGLVADLAPPDLATRLAILRKRVALDGIKLAEDAALEVVARRITGNARTLEGALIRVVAFHSLTGRRLDAELAEEVLAQLYPEPHSAARAGGITVADVQHLTCEAFGIATEELLGTSRSTAVTWPRQLAMYLAREHTRQSLPVIGRDFGGRNHTTVMHACRRAAARIETNADDRAMVEQLVHRLTTAS